MGSTKRIICILGMHRSGTSCLTGSLQEAGLNLGQCHTWNPFNLKGNRENQDFVDLHNEILEANGGSWENPPENAKWSLQHKQRARELLANFAEAEFVGFKDPRTLLVLEGWKELTDSLEFVGIFRHPDAVADSLNRRSNMARKEAIALWYTYNKYLYKEYKNHPFPILCFDDKQEIFEAKLNGLIEQLGLKAPCGPLQFYDHELKTSGAYPAPRLPWRAGRLYRHLRKSSI
jgi:hypothetical protein